MAWRSSFEGILAKNKTRPIQKIVRLSDVIFKSLWVMELAVIEESWLHSYTEIFYLINMKNASKLTLLLNLVCS